MIFCHDFAGARAQAGEALAFPNLSADDTADFAYLEGWSLYYLGQYKEAVPFLRRAVGRANCEKSERAFHLLALSFAHLGDTAEVNSTVSDWAKRFHPTGKEAAPFFTYLDSIADAATSGIAASSGMRAR
jgi:hypothetical protein